METLTFLLAMIGFAALAGSAVSAARGSLPRSLSAATASVVLVHVVLVWTFRYEGDIAQATRNGYAGFLIFHVALALIVAAPLLPPRPGRLATLVAFPIVCIGASGAVFRYDEVAIYRVPVILVAALGIVLIFTNARSASRRRLPE